VRLRTTGAVSEPLPNRIETPAKREAEEQLSNALRRKPKPPSYRHQDVAERSELDRVVERRRAVALARHYRRQESLTIAQIADRLGRSPATVKAYFYSPTGEKSAGGPGALSGCLPGLWRADPAAQWQRRRVRVLQSLSSGRNRTPLDA
jgi:AraC-like DNA-binding protein